MKRTDKDIIEAMEFIKSKHNGELPYKFGTFECAKMMAKYLKKQLIIPVVSRSFICVSEQTPPDNVELLVQDSYGNKHLTTWRKAYSIFSCQNKTESAEDWLWLQI